MSNANKLEKLRLVCSLVFHISELNNATKLPTIMYNQCHRAMSKHLNIRMQGMNVTKRGQRSPVRDTRSKYVFKQEKTTEQPE